MSYCCHFISKERINGAIENKLVKAEGFFNAGGRIFGVSLITGAFRVAFGSVEAVGAVVYALLKLIQAAGCKIFCINSRSFQQGTRALLYIPHGIANIVRGFLEMCQVGYVIELYDFSVEYPTQKNDYVLIDDGYTSDDATTDLVADGVSPKDL